MKKIFLGLLLLISFAGYSQLTSGNLVVYRVGDGSTALSSVATPVFLDEYTPAGVLVQSIPLPTAISGANRIITASGTATSEGLITRSIDGRYIFVTGYDAAVGTASITSSASTAINRIVGRIDAAGLVNSTTALSDYSTGSNPRGVISTDGTDIWVTGGAGGIRYTTFGSTTSTQISTTVTNLRTTGIFNGQLYTSSGSGAFRLTTVGTGTPTTAGQIITNLPGFPTTGSPYGFFFADLDAGVPGVDVVYVADDGTNTGFQKYSLVGGVWVSNSNIAVTGNALRGLVGSVSGNTVTLYGVSGTSLVKLIDATGYNTTISGTVSVLASVATNTAFRGIAFTPVSSSPTLTISSPLTAFGNICTNTTAGPNSFTISGTNLTNANVNLAALSGFTYSTTAGGTYTTTLSITQPGGTFSQQVFVKFTPTAVQSYNGNIVVSGGGASSSVNAAASGAGINTAPSVTTGIASAVTVNSATCAGTITATGCTAITAYGIEYSTTNGFADGSGTQVPSSNLSAGNFSSNLTGLASGTTYYFKAYATNSGGTTYGTQGNFTTGALVPTLTATALSGFGNVCINNTGGPNSFTINGTDLTNAAITVGPLNGFSFSTTAGGTYTASLNLTQPGGVFSQQIFVKFSPTLVQSYDGNIAVAGGGATSINVPVTGAGVNSTATVVTGAASSITTVSAVCAGSISSTGCTAITDYGIEYSTTSGFVGGTGTQVSSSNLSGGNFSSSLTVLSPNTTYYYMAYATNGGGTAYGAQLSFTTLALTPTLVATPLSSFGSVCVNTVAGPNMFSITGSALNNTNIVVGPLAGFSFSITSGGTYTASLNLAQPGGTFNQDVYVKFSPVAAISYNGNIPVSGGGAVSINVAATGAGVNTAPSVTTGAASAITGISATAAGNITATGCSAITAYGIEYSTTNGFANGSGTQVASSNLSGGNFSSNLTGLLPSTTYYYKAFATNSGGTTWGSQQSFITATPVLSATALTAFGNNCVNSTAGPNSFTITGTNLGTSAVTVAALSGYTYSTTAGGTYTASLSLTQAGGSFSQQVFVKFTPVAVQSYNGNIVVAGAGAAAINVPASGAGVNTAATVTTGAASAVTQTSATAAGTITATGCSAITAYGIEYSLTNGFANGTGTQVASSNLSAGAFSSNLTGLAPSTTYYYKAYATNGGGTSYGAQLSFTTSVPVLSASALAPFGSYCIGLNSASNTFTITGLGLTSAAVNVGPLNGYSFSTTSGGTYTASLSLTQPGGAYSQTIYVRFSPVAVQSYNGNIPVTGGGAAAINVAASGDGVNTVPAVLTGAASAITDHSVLLSGSLGIIGCSPVTSYGIEISGVNNFPNGSGQKYPSGNLTASGFSVPLNGLVQGATYYYKAYAINAGGIAYGSQLSFTVTRIADGFSFYPVPVTKGQTVRISMNNLKPGYYGLFFYNADGRQVYQRDMNIQADFINQEFTIPYSLTPGVYRIRLINEIGVVATRSIVIF